MTTTLVTLARHLNLECTEPDLLANACAMALAKNPVLYQNPALILSPELKDTLTKATGTLLLGWREAMAAEELGRSAEAWEMIGVPFPPSIDPESEVHTTIRHLEAFETWLSAYTP